MCDDDGQSSGWIFNRNCEQDCILGYLGNDSLIDSQILQIRNMIEIRRFTSSCACYRWIDPETIAGQCAEDRSIWRTPKLEVKLTEVNDRSR